MTEVWFFLVITLGGASVAVVPKPFATEAACKAEAARISRPSPQGGIPNAYGHCVRVETPKD